MRFLTAEQIFDGEGFLAPGSVLAIGNNGILQEIIRGELVGKDKVEVFDGILCPGFINAHCHTELSHMKGKIPRGTGLPAFGKHVITGRNKAQQEEIVEYIQEADKEMYRNGIVFCGDISNTDVSFKMKEQGKLRYHTFIELIGLNPERSTEVLKTGLELLAKLCAMGLKGSLAPHAPYSTSKELIRLIAGHNCSENEPSTIHFQESDEEITFFKGEPSGFDELYSILGMDISSYRPSGSSFAHIHGAIKGQRTLLVHNTVSSEEEVEGMKDRDVYYCFCPNANLYIEHRLPELKNFHDASKICFGTDSLASNSSLSVLKEAEVMITKKGMKTENALRALTGNAARFFGAETAFGRLIPKKNAGINLVDDREGTLRFIKKIT